ncbi:DNA-binding transcriptional regulator, AcrR family [Amycolatopsis arida]|uniref:DNA-binding transcriptional regulator, AcrR family n=1 Tax=Amycolatopsis arida TaxID=587909 RepID=A0A1I5LZN6_9PSEU|nr:TetR/AcrR family transcriptional regulator [Amycolatopsis arida]TDX93910.1 AcrR family transcriptional regulator [Amycolatopsis arida]SFP02745.1 DNA-binding transcriptional regulator, AcrR family [Amycolatopsis arida]
MGVVNRERPTSTKNSTVSTEGTASTENRTRARTRRAILEAAVAVLSQNPAASLGDIAASAGVGRTTVHRYFPERAHLMAALNQYALEQIAAATERARLDDGTALEAFDRLCQEYFELGELLTLLFNDVELTASDAWDEETDADRALLRLVERGHAEGGIDPELEPAWVQQLLWCVLYGAWQHVQLNGAGKHHALGLCLRTLAKALR